jgi:hypothetical protein
MVVLVMVLQEAMKEVAGPDLGLLLWLMLVAVLQVDASVFFVEEAWEFLDLMR